MDLTDLTRNLDAPGSDAFNVSPEEALRYWRGKGLRPSYTYADLSADEHRIAFTVAKMADQDLLKDVYDSLDEALATGMPFREWAESIEPLLRTKGWLGGDVPAYRLQTIFRTNLQTAYAQGQWDLIEAQAEDAPFLLYDAIDDGRTRPEHRAWDGTVLPVTSSWWRTHTPPCGFNCRCSVIQLDQDDLEALGIKPLARAPRTEFRDWKNPRTGQTERIPVGVDPGFGQAAADRVDRITRMYGEKIRAMAKEARAAAKAGAQATADAAAAAIAADQAAAAAEAHSSASAYVRERGSAAGNSIEYAVVFDEATGAEVLRKRGGRSHVNFDREQVETMRSASRAVMYHNHPSGYSLSTADLTFARHAGLSRIVAVANDHSGEYHASEFGDAVLVANTAKRIDLFLRNRIGRLHSDGILDTVEANHLHCHLANVLLDAVGLVRYEARILPPALRNARGKAGLRYGQWIKEWNDEYRRP